MSEPLIFVRWKHTTSEETKLWAKHQRGMKRVPSDEWDKVGIELYSLPPGLAKKSVEWLIEKGWAEAEEDGEGEGIPIDPSIGEAMSFNDLLAGNTWYQRRVGIPSAWSKTTGAGVKIGVADSGANHEHEWLQGSIVASKNFVIGETTVNDNEGHGTACAGIVKAIARDCSLVVARVMSQNSAKWSAVGAGWMWLADQGCIVASTSIGGQSDSFSLSSAAAYCNERGCVPICAAGNAGTQSNSYPANTRGCIAVSATDEGDNKAGFSQWGEFIDITAPGVSLLTSHGGGYNSFSGTSGSAPIVSGCVGLVAANYGMNGTDSLQALMITCRNLGNALYFGSGIPDLLKALAVDVPVPDPEPPPPDPDPEPPPTEPPPTKMDAPTVKSISSDSVTVQWVPVSDLYPQNMMQGWFTQSKFETVGANVSEYTWRGLRPDTNYKFSVSVPGAGITSDVLVFKTLAVDSPPPPPPPVIELSTSTLTALVVIENDISTYNAGQKDLLRVQLQRLLGLL